MGGATIRRIAVTAISIFGVHTDELCHVGPQVVALLVERLRLYIHVFCQVKFMKVIFRQVRPWPILVDNGLAFATGFKVGLFLSDISGAFDKVSAERLLGKLARAGVCPSLLKLLQSYLAARTAVVVSGGASSEPFVLKDTVFQGTVLGPVLWNVFSGM